MSNDQLSIDFSQLRHSENTKENQFNFDTHIKHFSKQCQTVYYALLRGERLTTSQALLRHSIGDLRRRVKDLKDIWQIPVQSVYAKDQEGNDTRYKEYYLDQAFIDVNKIKCTECNSNDANTTLGYDRPLCNGCAPF